MEKNKFTWIDGLIVLIFMVVVYMLLTRIFGHSATDLAITVGLFVLLFTNQYKINREMGELKSNMAHSFNKIREDVGLIRTRLRV